MIARKDYKVFIVDDDTFCRELYAQYLRNSGFQDIHLFDGGQECIGNLALRPDIILLDYAMEPVDGLETLKKIKRFDPNIYIVMVSGKDDIQMSINTLKYGAFDYITKGERDEEMITRIMDKIVNIMGLMNPSATDGPFPRFMSFQ